MEKSMVARGKDLLLSTKYGGEARRRLKSKRLASSSKRLDICAMQFAHNFHLSGRLSLSGKVCLEIGAGLVLSHAVVCHLLGAKRVVATDISPLAFPQSLGASLRNCVPSVIRDILSPFEDHELLRKRLERLLSVRRFDFRALHDLGIDYIAPIDLAGKRLGMTVDFIFSNSVLQHVPCEDVSPLLHNVASALSPDGVMIHCLHLEDVQNASADPFAFLSVPEREYSRAWQSARGNRIRKSGWQEVFSRIENTHTEFIYEWTRKDRKLPSRIDPSVRHVDAADLITSHIGVLTRRTSG